MSQRYIASDLTHFVGRGEPDDDSRYQTLIKIINDGWLTSSPHNNKTEGIQVLIVDEDARVSDNSLIRPAAVCFCDIPQADLAIHMDKYSFFGLAFAKAFLITKGATPVYYISKDTLDAGRPLREKFDHHISEFMKTFDALYAGHTGVDPEFAARLKSIRQFCEWNIFSFIKFFDHSLADTDENNYYFEREWRTLANVNFSLGDIVRIILPQSYAGRLRRDLPAYCGEVVFSK